MLYSELSHTDKEALWMAFEKRFPLGLSKEFLLKESRLSKRVSLESPWHSIFEQLEIHPKDFHRLLKTAVEMRPDDSNLCEMVDILCPPAPIGLFATVASVISFGVLLSVLFPPSEEVNAFASVDQSKSELAAIQRFETLRNPENIEDIVSDSLDPVLLPDAGSEEKIPGSAQSLDENIITPKTVSHRTSRDQFAAITHSQNQSSPEALPPRCSFEGTGEVMGYWYAGSEAPVIIDGWTTIEHGRNVRLDYPEKHNNYDARSPVSCVLYSNQRVPVQDEPILVAGGKYWIPLRSIPRG